MFCLYDANMMHTVLFYCRMQTQTQTVLFFFEFQSHGMYVDLSTSNHFCYKTKEPS